MTFCKHCGNTFPIKVKWFRHEVSYCTSTCWNDSKERKQMIEENKDLFSLSDEEKLQIIKSKGSKPESDRDSLYFELSKSTKKY